MLVGVADPASTAEGDGGEARGRVAERGRPLDALAHAWEQEALRRGARWFGIACACLPVLDVLDGHSVIDAVMAGASVGAWPEVPLRVWGMLVWVAAAAVAAGRLIAWLAPGPRMGLFAVCALMHSVYAVTAGARLSAIVAMAAFAYSFVVLQEARETWPEGHPGAPRR